MADYKTIRGTSTFEYEEKRSRFIATAAFADTEEKALTVLNAVRAANRTARHNVYAYVLQNGRTRYSDDGEPAKTAGTPVLETIGHAGVADVIVVVTRYFGGILLGLLTAFVYDRTCEKAHRGILGGVFSGVRWSFACVAALAAVLAAAAGVGLRTVLADPLTAELPLQLAALAAGGSGMAAVFLLAAWPLGLGKELCSIFHGREKRKISGHGVQL